MRVYSWRWSKGGPLASGHSLFQVGGHKDVVVVDV